MIRLPHHRALYLAASSALLAVVVIAGGAWFMPAGLDAACREVPGRAKAAFGVGA